MIRYFFLFLAVRLLLCLFVTRNYDHPDEEWQGPEIAHKIAFGYALAHLGMVLRLGNGGRMLQFAATCFR